MDDWILGRFQLTCIGSLGVVLSVGTSYSTITATFLVDGVYGNTNHGIVDILIRR